MKLGKPIKLYVDQLKKAKMLDFDVIIPGHGNIGGPEDLDIYIDYLSTLISQVELAIADGKSLQETQAGINMDRFKTLKRYDDWFLFNVEGVYEQLK